jgi:hypothetical protein
MRLIVDNLKCKKTIVLILFLFVLKCFSQEQNKIDVFLEKLDVIENDSCYFLVSLKNLSRNNEVLLVNKRYVFSDNNIYIHEYNVSFDTLIVSFITIDTLYVMNVAGNNSEMKKQLFYKSDNEFVLRRKQKVNVSIKIPEKTCKTIKYLKLYIYNKKQFPQIYQVEIIKTMTENDKQIKK